MEVLEKIQQSEASAGAFQKLNNVDEKQLVNLIQGEHPQTISLILGHLKPKQAAGVLTALPAEVQPDVISRMATMGQISPETVAEIEGVLKQHISTMTRSTDSQTGGVNVVAEILNLVDRSTEKNILGVMERENPDLAIQIKNLMFVFEDVLHLGDRRDPAGAQGRRLPRPGGGAQAGLRGREDQDLRQPLAARRRDAQGRAGLPRAGAPEERGRRPAPHRRHRAQAGRGRRNPHQPRRQGGGAHCLACCPEPEMQRRAFVLRPPARRRRERLASTPMRISCALREEAAQGAEQRVRSDFEEWGRGLEERTRTAADDLLEAARGTTRTHAPGSSTEAADEVVGLAFAVARRVLRREVDADPAVALPLVRELLQRVAAGARVTVRLSPRDHAMLSSSTRCPSRPVSKGCTSASTARHHAGRRPRWRPRREGSTAGIETQLELIEEALRAPREEAA